MNEVFVKLKRNFGLTLILVIGLGIEFTNFQSMFFRFMLEYRPDWGAINHVPAMFLSAFLLLCIVIYGIRKQVILSWFLAMLTCIISFTVYSRMELSWEWDKMDEINFVVLVLSAMLPMLVAYSTHQIAQDEEEDINDVMAEIERKRRRQMQSQMLQQKELQYAQENKRLKASLAQALRQEERMKMNDLYRQDDGFSYKEGNNEELAPIYQKAKYTSQHEDLAEKFAMSKQYNSANFAPIRDKSVNTKPQNKTVTENKADVSKYNGTSKLKTTPKIAKTLDEEVEIDAKETPMNKENLAKKFMQEFEQSGKQQEVVQEPEREVVFNFVPKVSNNKPIMQETNAPIRVAGGYKIACVHCGKETIKKSKTAKYCSTSCRVAHNKAAGINDDGKSPAFYLVNDDFDNAGVIEWANSESL
ncbi:MAG: zinc finger MYND domain-containing protein [Cytophagales bacterium]|nr:MAG: zinc finger MYND domain-containing protein [Cytophagales bacterium]